MALFYKYRFYTLFFSLLLCVSTVAVEISIEDFAIKNNVDMVTLSPDGKSLALINVQPKSSQSSLQIYKTTKLTEKPFIISSEKMDILHYKWVGDEHILVNTRFKERNKAKGYRKGVYSFGRSIINTKTSKLYSLVDENYIIQDLLISDPDHIIVSGFSGLDAKKYYKLNLLTWKKELITREKGFLNKIYFDKNAKPIIAKGFNKKTKFHQWFKKNNENNDWELFYQLDENSFEKFDIQTIDDTNPNILWVLAHNQKDTKALWEFDVTKKNFTKLIAGNPNYDVDRLVKHSNFWTKDTIIGTHSYSQKTEIIFLDKDEESLYANLMEVIPNSYDIKITGKSRDGNISTIYNSGPNDPGTYYLKLGNKIELIGTKKPALSANIKSKVEHISWESKDKLKINGELTIPKGEAPYPLVVLPHDKPFNTAYSAFHEWSQLLASQGYLVLQPHYRGTGGYGINFYKSAFIPDSNNPSTIYDDVSSGVKSLIDKGFIDSNKIAIAGWGFGGNLALIAAAQEDQIYQCSIAANAISNNITHLNYFRENLNIRGYKKTEQVDFWTKNQSPINFVEQVNIPVLILHGSLDATTPIDQSKKYRSKLKKHKKDFSFVEIEDMDHNFIQTKFESRLKFYSTVIEYLNNSCNMSN